MRLFFISCGFALLFASTTTAGTDFGTRTEARALAESLISIVETEGIDAAIDAVYSEGGPFQETRMGVNLFKGTFVIADNREPEMVAADYSSVPDLTGENVWPRIAAAAERSDDVVLKWYHYDTQAVYDYHCFSMRADRDDAAVMICR